MKQAIILASITVALIVGIAGGYFYPVAVSVGSPSGTTFNSAKVASVVMVPTSASATSSSVYNGDASDRIIDSAFVACFPAVGSVFAQTSAGVANWTWIAATTSTNAPATITNTNLALNVNVSTSSTNDSYIATSTYTNVITRRWAAGTYLTFQPNATSSVSGVNCTPGVYYHGS